MTIDTLRADHCGFQGYPRPTTPRLDGFAREGVSFRTAYAPAPLTAPTHATLFTAFEPAVHGITKNGLTLSSDRSTLAEILRDRGYQTSAVVSSFVLHRRFGLAQGFETYEDGFDREHSTAEMKRWKEVVGEDGVDRRAHETTKLAQAWLSTRDPRRPFFLWVHYFDPHLPYVPPAPYEARFAPAADAPEVEKLVRRYDAEIAYTDHELGELVDELDRVTAGEETLLVVTADHGEGLFQHGRLEHGPVLYEEDVRVPLVFRGPGVPAGRTVESPVPLLDVLPTILDLLGATPPPNGVQGKSLVGPMTGKSAEDPSRAIFLQSRQSKRTVKTGHGTAVRAGSWKYIEGPGGPELYDLRDDPKEQRNLVRELDRRASELAEALRAWRESHAKPEAPAPTVPKEAADRLRALGYVD